MGFSLKQGAIFIAVFISTLIVDFLLFAGLIKSVGEDNTQWLMNNPVLSILAFFVIFFAIPGIVAYYVAFRDESTDDDLSDNIDQGKRLKFAAVFTIMLFLAIMGLLTLTPSKFEPYTMIQIDEEQEFGQLVIPTLIKESTTSTFSFPTPTFILTPTPTTRVTAFSPTSTPLPTSTPTPTFTPTPTPRTPNPPVLEITYPSEMQSIEFTSSSQIFCAVEVPAGGDTSNLQRKHSINDGSWSSYTTIFTLCFNPVEGLNRFQVQYKNKYGDESTMYTRQFNFHKAY